MRATAVISMVGDASAQLIQPYQKTKLAGSPLIECATLTILSVMKKIPPTSIYKNLHR